MIPLRSLFNALQRHDSTTPTVPPFRAPVSAAVCDFAATCFCVECRRSMRAANSLLRLITPVAAIYLQPPSQIVRKFQLPAMESWAEGLVKRLARGLLGKPFPRIPVGDMPCKQTVRVASSNCSAQSHESQAVSDRVRSFELGQSSFGLLWQRLYVCIA